MKKIILTALLLIASASAMAQYHGPRHGHGHGHGHWHRGHGGTWNWVVPAIIGGAVVYGATRPAEASPVIVQQPVIIQSPVDQNCSPWKEIQTPDGKIYRERTCTQ